MSRADELAAWLERHPFRDVTDEEKEAAAELRRLSAVNAELLEALKAAKKAAGKPEIVWDITRAAIQKAEEA